MTATRDEIESRVVADHIALRGLATRMEALAGEVARGERRLLGALLTEARALQGALRIHHEWESATLLPRLRRAGRLGEQRAGYLEKDHGIQIAILARAIESLETQDLPPPSLAREIIDLSGQLRDDLADEEEMVLDEKLWSQASMVDATPEGSE